MLGRSCIIHIGIADGWIVRVQEHGDEFGVRYNLVHHLDTFGDKHSTQIDNAGDIATRSAEAGHARRNWINT